MSSEGESNSRLGRGLAALIGDVDDLDEVGRAPLDIRLIPTEHLHPNPRNPRKNFDADSLEELVSSIKEKGILQPILARPDQKTDGEYEIIAGERRWRAAQRCALADIPVIILEFDDQQAAEVAIIENVQRSDLNPIEEADGYQQLIGQFGYTQATLAKTIGKSRSHLANTLRLLKLPEDVRIYVQQGQLSAGHARALVPLKDSSALAKKIVDQGLSVRDVEAMVRGDQGDDKKADLFEGGTLGSGTGASTQAETGSNADIRFLENELANVLGMNVQLKDKNGQGTIAIQYRNLDQLDMIITRLRG